MAQAQHSLDPVRAALREFEDAVRRSERKLGGGSKVLKQQEVDRKREHVMESIMELVRQTLREKGVA